jgi:hypothetical protein
MSMIAATPWTNCHTSAIIEISPVNCLEVKMLPVIAGVGAVLLVLAGAKYLSSRSSSPGPDEPPPPVDEIPIADAGADG